MIDTLEDLAEVLTVISKLDMTGIAPLTDDELDAINAAHSVIRLAGLITDVSGDPTAKAILQVVSQLPAIALLIAGFVASLRSVIVRAQELEIDIGPLGPGVKVEPL